MADSSIREEKLAAGLKKFKQFQQRSGRKVMRQRINESPVDSANVSSSQGTEPCIPPQKEVPSSVQKCSSDLEQSKTISCSSTDISMSASNDSSIDSPQKNSFPDSALKSKSDLDLSNVTELSSAESLRQISLQVNGLMSETDALINGNVEADISVDLENQSLEKRNQELAQMVNSLRQSNDQLYFQLQEQKAIMKRQNMKFTREKQELQEKSHKEQVTLNDQLKVHIQTIGILVAEKTELKSSLTLNQQTAKQKAGEVEELQGRLRASRKRASDLERELISLSNSNQQHEKVKQESSKEIERLKLDNYKLGKTNDDLKLANVELSEKLNKKISELQNMEKELSECCSKLSATELQVHQLSSDSSTQNVGQLEEVYQQKFELEKRLSLHKESIDKLINERDQMSEQYQQYIQQLSQQVTSLREEIQQLSSEKGELSKERNTLKEKLESLSSTNDGGNKEDSSELKLQINILEHQKQELSQKLETEATNVTKMTEQLQQQDEKIQELHRCISRLHEDQVDQSHLLETMQSDKVAASRAVTQNRELKKQLEELQGGFVSMSNDKLELAEKFHSEQHITRELGERLSQQEEELRELREQLTEKEVELQNLQKSNTKGIYQQNQIADRMRHYEAQGQLVEMMQKELHQAQEQIKELTTQNSELRMAVATQAEVTVSDEYQKEDKDASKRNDLVASLSASVRQLEMERNQLMKQLDEQKANRTNLEEQMKKKEMQLHKDVNGTNEGVSREKHDVLKKAMEQLEERFKQTMSKIAELSDERQQLEHLVMQLQGETDTIGDYIALYQIQRGLMRKRASEKDEYIAQLARDREDLKAKLGELQGLVIRLMEERKQFQCNSTDIELTNIDISSKQRDSSGSPVPSILDSNIEDIESPLLESDKKQGTAEKIMDLLTEIETTNLVEKPLSDTFHPCPVCSGRLITV